MEWTLVVVLGVAVAVVLVVGLLAHWRRRRRRVLWEDALKQICGAKGEGQSVTHAELGGRLIGRVSLLTLLAESSG